MSSGTLLSIAARGNFDRTEESDNWITCADGFRLSVIAGSGAYCSPRPAFSSMYLPNIHEVPSTYPGPYTHVEVGFPSERPEPWSCHHERTVYGDDEWAPSYCKERPVTPDEGTGWACYAEAESDPTGTVYGYVPVAMVAALIASHGGEA